jgi:hypothetical protein
LQQQRLHVIKLETRAGIPPARAFHLLHGPILRGHKPPPPGSFGRNSIIGSFHAPETVIPVDPEEGPNP